MRWIRMIDGRQQTSFFFCCSDIDRLILGSCGSCSAETCTFGQRKSREVVRARHTLDDLALACVIERCNASLTIGVLQLHET